MKKRLTTVLCTALLITVLIFTQSGCNKPKNGSDSESSNGENSSNGIGDLPEVVDMSGFENISILDFGAVSDGSADISDAVKKFKNEIKENQCLYFPSGKYLVSADLTIEVPVKLDGSVTIEVADQANLTVSSLFSAGIQKIFTGSGNVKFTSNNVWGYPNWFDDGGLNLNDLIQKAVNSLRCMYLMDGKYQLSDITLSNPITIKGIGAMKIQVEAQPATKALFHIKSSDVHLENFQIDMGKVIETATSCVFFDTSSGRKLENIVLKNFDITGGYVAIKDADSDGSVVNALLSGVQFWNTKETPLIMKDFLKDIKLVEVSVMRRNITNGKCDVPGVIVENTEGMIFEHFDVNGDVEKFELEGHGVVFRNSKNVEMYRTLMEYHGGIGYLIEDCANFYFENAQVYTFYNVGMQVKNLTDSKINELKVTYTSLAHLPPAKNTPSLLTAKYDNIILEGCKNVEFNNVLTAGARGAGISLKNNENITINSLNCTYRESQSILDLGGNKNFLINGFIDMSTEKGGISLADGGITVKNAILGGNEPVEAITGKGIY